MIEFFSSINCDAATKVECESETEPDTAKIKLTLLTAYALPSGTYGVDGQHDQA
jgi:hypothetical protein